MGWTVELNREGAKDAKPSQFTTEARRHRENTESSHHHTVATTKTPRHEGLTKSSHLGFEVNRPGDRACETNTRVRNDSTIPRWRRLKTGADSAVFGCDVSVSLCDSVSLWLELRRCDVICVYLRDLRFLRAMVRRLRVRCLGVLEASWLRRCDARVKKSPRQFPAGGSMDLVVLPSS